MCNLYDPLSMNHISLELSTHLLCEWEGLKPTMWSFLIMDELGPSIPRSFNALQYVPRGRLVSLVFISIIIFQDFVNF